MKFVGLFNCHETYLFLGRILPGMNLPKQQAPVTDFSPEPSELCPEYSRYDNRYWRRLQFSQTTCHSTCHRLIY
nr:unnamed protein product [Spirometra erinaceieuropaei]